MASGLTATDPALGAIGREMLRMSMRLMFRPVFGWRGPGIEGIEYFEIAGVDNSVLNGARCETRAVAKGVVILCHPFLKYGMNYFFQNGYHGWLTTAGYHAVAFNFKGFGTSTLAGVSFADDVTSAVLWTRERYPALPCHLFGVSFGGYHGVHALARRGARVSSIVLDSVPASLARYFSTGLVGTTMRWLSTSRWANVTGTRTIVDSLCGIADVPCLFLYGREDRFISADEIARIGSVCGAGKMLTYDGCGHLEIRKRYPEAYARDAIGFFDRHGRRSDGD